MSTGVLDHGAAIRRPRRIVRWPARSNAVVAYSATVAMVGVAALVGFLITHLIAAPNVTLVFVLPVVIAATSFGFMPALAAAGLGVLAFDFFFTAPFYSFRIHSAADLWAALLLLVIAAIVSSVAADARRRALVSAREAERANALHDLAHLVVQAAPPAEVAQATAETLSRIFRAPAVVLIQQADALQPTATTNGADLAAADIEAARWTVDSQLASHADNYPFESSTFDFWPIRRQGSPDLVLGVRCGDADERPEHPARYVELAGAYLAASLTAPAHPR